MKRSELFFSAITLPLDYLALLAAALVAYYARFLPAIQQIRPVVFDLPLSNYLWLSAAIALGWIAIFAISGLYAISSIRHLAAEVSRIVVACSAGLSLVLAVMVFSRYLFDSRFIILVSWMMAVVFVTFERIAVRLIQRQAYKTGLGVHRVGLIGEGPMAEALAHEFTAHPTLGFRIVSRWPAFDAQVGNQISELAKGDKIDEILQVSPNQSQEATAALIETVNTHHLDFRYTADLVGMQLTGHDIVTIAGTPIVEVKRTPLDGWGRIAKRCFDIVGAGVLLMLTSPLLVVTAAVIKLTSPGPVFFAYTRAGQFGKPFRYFKFRSMIKDAHAYRFDPEFLALHPNLREGTPMMKFKNDPRITPVGRFIRRFSIDELPELLLVLVGKMSLVGPRPHELEEVQRYQSHHRKLLTLKPGMTGMAQVSGRSDLNFEDEVRLDMYYIEHWSLGLDLKILFKTPWAVLRPRQAE